MVAYNLHYFNTTSRGELIRLIFTVMGQLFTDTRVNIPDWPGNLKAAAPWGGLPYLEVNGNVIGQTKAIIRYVSHEGGLGGRGRFNQALVDSVVETARDVWDNLYAYQMTRNPEAKDAAREKIKAGLSSTLPHLERFIRKYGQHGYSVGSSLTTADLAIFDAIDQIQSDPSAGIPDATEGFLKVRGVVDHVKANPRIAAYLAKRNQQSQAQAA